MLHTNLMAHLSRWGRRWEAFAARGLTGHATPMQRRRVRLFWTFSLVTAVLFGLFAADNLLAPYGNRLVGQAYAGAAVFTLLNLALFRGTGWFGLARTLYFICFTLVLQVLLTTGGILSAGILWFFLFPPVAFYLTGRKNGVRLIGLLFAVTLGTVGLDLYGYVEVPYSYLLLRQLALSVLLVAAIIYLQERGREQDELSLERREREALAANARLRQEVAERQKAEATLARRTRRLETANRQLTETRGAMERVLEDLQRTKVELEERNAVMQMIQTVAVAANEAGIIDEVLETALRQITAYTGWPVGHVYSVGQERRLLPAGIWQGPTDTRLRPVREAVERSALKYGQDIPGRAWKKGGPAWSGSLGRSKRFDKAMLDRAGIRGSFAVPVRAGSETLAVLEFLTDDNPQPSKQLLDGLQAMTAQIGHLVERQRSEADREQLASIIESTSEAVVGKNLKGIVTSWNNAAERMYGYTADEMIGQPISRLFPADLRGDHEQIMKTVRAGKTIDQFETRRLTKDGREIEVAVTISPIKRGNRITGAAAMARDITDKKRLERAQQQLAAIVESTEDAIIGATLDGRIVSWNRGAERLYGYAAEEVVNKKGDFLTPPSRKAELRELLARVNAGESVDRYDTVRVRKDGSLVDVSITVSPILAPSGETLGISIIARDITEQRRVDQMKTDFVSMVSHQLKTPVGEIRGYVENMLMGIAGELTAKQREYLQEMLDISVNNYDLINDLLNVSRLERGVVNLAVTSVALGEIVDFALRDYKDALRRKGLKLTVKGKDLPILVQADVSKMGEALRNVINNAVKFTDRGGLTITVSAKHGLGIVKVTDTGPGMTKAELKEVFTRRQILSGRPHAGGGAGLGMYIAKNFMNLQHGDVTATSKRHVGTTFTFSVPLAAPVKPSRKRTLTARNRNVPNKKKEVVT